MLEMKIAKRELTEKALMFIAWRLPKKLILWCAVRLMAHATQGEYGTDHPDDVSIMDALERWENA